MQVKFEPITGQWRITDKSYGKGNVKATSVYGTSRVNAYNIIEDSLNLKDVRVFDYIEDENGNKKAVLNKKETTIAQGKQEEIRRKFEEWIWKDPNRRERLCKLYNEKPALLWASGLRRGRANRDGGISAGVYLPFGRGVSGGQAGTHGRRDALAEHCRQLCRKRKGNMERGNGENGLQK